MFYREVVRAGNEDFKRQLVTMATAFRGKKKDLDRMLKGGGGKRKFKPGGVEAFMADMAGGIK